MNSFITTYIVHNHTNSSPIQQNATFFSRHNMLNRIWNEVLNLW